MPQEKTYRCLICGTTTPFPHNCPAFQENKNVTVEIFRLSAVSLNEFTDSQVKNLFLSLEVNSVEDIHQAISILKKHRPELLKEIEEMFKE